MRWLPINQDIVMPENAPLPIELVERFIEETSHRVIAAYCGCRKGFGCEHYPHDIGCLMMGDSALEIKRYGCHEVGVEEAKAHLHRAVDAGLVPIVGKGAGRQLDLRCKGPQTPAYRMSLLRVLLRDPLY